MSKNFWDNIWKLAETRVDAMRERDAATTQTMKDAWSGNVIETTKLLKQAMKALP